jgi:hypothetical protein
MDVIVAETSCWDLALVPEIYKQGDFLDFFSMYFIEHCFICRPSDHCVGGCWDRTQDCCDFGIGSQTF